MSVEPSGQTIIGSGALKNLAALCVFWKRAPVVIKVFFQFIHEYQALV